MFQIAYNANNIQLEVVDSETLSNDAVIFNDAAIAIYPNPTTDVLQIKGLRLDTKATVYSVLGSKLLEMYVTPSQNKILIDQLKAGTYFLALGTKSYPFVKN